MTEEMKNVTPETAEAPEHVETMEDYKEELEASFKQIHEGDILTGTVIGVSENGVTLDLKYYTDGLIRPEDFVYLDAGTTTGYMLEHLEGSGATFVTNGVSHARALAQMGVRVLLIGGELKGSTEAVIGSQAMQMLKNYHFTKGFFGTNGMTQREGFTTPESNEALVKRTAMEQCLEKYVVSDSSKFGQISAVTFFSFDGAVILTESCSKEYKDCRNIQIVS